MELLRRRKLNTNKQACSKNMDVSYKDIYKITDITNLPNEEWRPILGYEGLYEVSSLGRIKSLLTNRILKQWFGGNKQLLVTLCADGIKHKQYVSNIVGVCFLGVANRKENEVYVHLNMCKTDNRACNIGIETKHNERLLAYHLGVLKDWGIKDMGVKTRFVPQYLYIGTKKNGEEEVYTSEELIDKFGSGARSIMRCIEKKSHFNTAYKMTWRKEKIANLQ